MSYYPSALSLSLPPPPPTSFLVRAPDIIQHSAQRGPSPFYPRRPIVFHYIPFYPLPGYSRVALQTSLSFSLLYESSPISGKRGRNFRDSFERLEGYINFRWRFSRSLIKEGVEGSLRKKGEGRLLYLIRKLYSFRGLALFD